MFNTLSDRLRGVLDQVRGRGRLTEENIQDAVRDVRRALIEADVALPVVRDFVELVRQRALGADVLRSLTPGQVFIRIIHEELTRTLGDGVAELNLRHQPPAVILLAGLQGAGKTTTAAKLALFIRERLGKRVGLVSTDTQRPAAILQLERLASSIAVPFLTADVSLGPIGIAERALADGAPGPAGSPDRRHRGPQPARRGTARRAARACAARSIRWKRCSSSTAWPGRTR